MSQKFGQTLKPLADRVEEIMQEVAKFDPLVRIALDRRCELKQKCKRGPFGCECGRRLQK